MAAVSELTRDKDGFLKCKYCPRRFLTELMFENHSSCQHKKEIEMKQNKKNEHSQTIKDEIYVPNNTQSEEEFALGSLSFVSQVDSTVQSIEHQKTSHHKFRECKKLFNSIIVSLYASWSIRPNPEVQINRKLKD